MVTRTLKTTEATYLCVDIDTAEVCNKTCTFSGHFDDDEKCVAIGRTMLECDTIKVVSLVKKIEYERKYGMSENDFIKYSIL